VTHRQGLKSVVFRVTHEAGDSFDALRFVCAICERDVTDFATRSPQNWHEWPICKTCERTWGRPKGIGYGAFRDRRIANQILALSEVINAEAHRGKHGTA
jgi:hypothetical protein